MKTYRGENLRLHSLLTSTVAEDEWATSRPGRFKPREQHRFPWNGRTNEPDIRDKRKTPCPTGIQTPDRLLQS